MTASTIVVIHLFVAVDLAVVFLPKYNILIADKRVCKKEK